MTKLTTQEENILLSIRVAITNLQNIHKWKSYTNTKELTIGEKYFLVTATADVVMAKILNRPCRSTGHVYVQDAVGISKEVRPFLYKKANTSSPPDSSPLELLQMQCNQKNAVTVMAHQLPLYPTTLVYKP